MFTVIETPTFVRLANDCWSEEDRTAFITFIAGNPDAGDVVPGSGGVRKARWGSAGRGKRGGGASYLLQSPRRWRNLVAAGLRKTYTRQHPDACAPADQRGD